MKAQEGGSKVGLRLWPRAVRCRLVAPMDAGYIRS